VIKSFIELKEKMLPSKHGPHYKHLNPQVILSLVTLEMKWKKKQLKKKCKANIKKPIIENESMKIR
jgi:hypothetical protein